METQMMNLTSHIHLVIGPTANPVILLFLFQIRFNLQRISQCLITLVFILAKGAFGTWQWFAKRYCDAKYRIYGKKKQWDTNGASNLEELQNKLIGKLMIRRLKSEVSLGRGFNSKLGATY